LREELDSRSREVALVEQTKSQIQDALNEKIKEYMVVEQDLQTRAHKAETLLRDHEK